MGYIASAIALAGAAVCFMVGASGVQRVRLYGLGWLLLVLAILMVVVVRSQRVSLTYVAHVILAGFLALQLAGKTRKPHRVLHPAEAVSERA